MPRLAPALLREARASHVLLPQLLRECRDLPSARNELRWLQEHAHENYNLPGRLVTPNKALWKTNPSIQEEIWKNLTRNVYRRAKGEPLQYILGTQPFGKLQILCREGVLIPRPETEAYTARLGSILNTACRSNGNTVSQGDTLRILDLCTGTGCISLLLHSMLKPVGGDIGRKVKIMGIDISDQALALARDNLEYNIGENLLDLSAVSDVTFRKASVFDIGNDLAGDGLDLGSGSATFDVIISNPPYVAEKDYQAGGTTTRSVRKFEPKLALVPEPSRTRDLSPGERRSPTNDGDAFYQPLLDIAGKVEASIVILETGDHHQALRVHRMAKAMYRQSVPPAIIEIWDDDASDIELANAARHRARSVVIWTGNAAQMRKFREDRMHSADFNGA